MPERGPPADPAARRARRLALMLLVLVFLLSGQAQASLNPPAPSLTSTSPSSPSVASEPLIVGSAEAGTTVKLYTNASCSGTPLATGTAAALASPGIRVGVGNNTTTSFYATATDGLGSVSECSRPISYTERSDPLGIAASLARLPVRDAFATAENPLSGGGRWTKLSWDANTGQVSGSGTSGGWGPFSPFPAAHGAYWNPEAPPDEGAGVAVAATLSVSPSAAERWFSLWLDLSQPERAQNGYELRFTNVDGADRYDVTLSKWVSGTRTVLATASGYTLAPQSSFALVDHGATVSAWVDGGAGFGQLLSASDATFLGGWAGIEGAGNITRIRQFKMGSLRRETAGLLERLPGLDAFAVPENPLSGRGMWTKLATASHAGQVTSTGWGPYNAFPAVHGAWWNQERFTDNNEGDAIAATLSVSPSSAERYVSVWLDMPEPERAQTGYELRFKQTATANAYAVTLSKWQSGVRTVLASASSYTLMPGSSFALVDNGATVSAWTDTGSGWGQLLSASDLTFSRGYVAVEAAGNITRIKDLRVGDSLPGYTDVKHVGEVEMGYQDATGAFTYRAESGSTTLTGHLDPVGDDGGFQQLPFRPEPVACATSGHRIKVVYSTSAYPSTPTAEVQAVIRGAVARMNAKFVAESRRTSGNARTLRMRVDCDASGNVNVYSMTVGPDAAEYSAQAAQAAFGNPRGASSVKYLIFRDAPDYQVSQGRYVAGLAYLRDDEARKSSADDASGNKNRTETSAAIINRGSPEHSEWLTDATVHELTHAMGAVLHPTGDFPPFATTGDHCTDGVDIMCYDDGSLQRYTEERCPRSLWEEPDAVPLDCGGDTYFNASPSVGGWLGTHWNVGGRENPFLVE